MIVDASAGASEFDDLVQVRIDVYTINESVRSGLVHFHGFQLLVLLSLHVESGCTNNESTVSKTKFRLASIH